MIPQVFARTESFGPRMAYLVGVGRTNEHESPHLVGGSPHIMAWHSHGTLSHEDALSISADLDQAHQVFGVDVNGGHVWHCALSLHRLDGQLGDPRWEELSTDFMRRMGFIDVEGKADVPWVAVHHGVSGQSGNDHVHLLVSTVRTDGTKADIWMDYRRAQAAAAEMEAAHGLSTVKRELSPLYSTHQERAAAAARGRTETDREMLERSIRAAAVASTSEAEFVRRLRGDGLYLKASMSGDTVRGYAAALRPVKDEAPIYYAGSKVARDLGLGTLRQRWPVTREGALEADAEWTAATRGLRVVAPGREQEDPTFSSGHMGQVMDQWQARLASLDPADKEGWRSASADLAGVFAHWSRVTEPEPGPLAELSKELSRSAQLSRREYRPADHTQVHSPLGPATSLMLSWASTQNDARMAVAVYKRMVALAGAVKLHTEATGDLVRQRGLEAVARDQLVELNRDLHDRAGMILPGRVGPGRDTGRGPSVLPPVMTRQTQKTGEMTR